MSKPICTVMVGLPGLGKTTLVDRDRKVYSNINLDLFVYSTDDYIEQQAKALNKTYNDVFEDYIGKATARMNALLDVAIKDNIDIIWDQTNLSVNKRRKIINRMKQAGYRVGCACVVPPEAGWLDDQKVWARRLANRPGKTIPQNILTNMIESFTVPTIEEGFDVIDIYNMHSILLSIDYGEEKL